MKKLLTRLLLMSALFTPLLFNSVDDVDYARAFGRFDTLKLQQGDNFDTNQNPKQMIGYGYNIANDQLITEPGALNINLPILDIKNPKLAENIEVFNTTYENSWGRESETKSGIAKLLTADIGLNSFKDFQVATNKIGLGNHFDMNLGINWTKTMQEQFSYYVIYMKTKPVVLQLELNQIREFLDSRFVSNINAIKDISSARSVLEKYGTHLLTGYTLGGIFEMTNYFAASSSVYQRQAKLSFEQQVVNATTITSDNKDFSFSGAYGAEDNNAYAQSKYICHTYGGDAAATLTIDQAFSKRESIHETKYEYFAWMDSINNGKNLVIVDIPQSAPMIPIWDLLPDSMSANKTREYLIDAYVELCGGSLEAYKAENKDIFPTNLNNGGANANAQYVEKGYNYQYPLPGYKSLYSYVQTSEIENYKASVHPGSVITMDYDIKQLRSHKIHWELSAGTTVAELIDPLHGVVKIKPDCDRGEFDLHCLSDGTTIFTQKFKIQDMFSGGAGTKENPYLISNRLDFQILSGRSELWGLDNYYKLVNDIEFDIKAGNAKGLEPIGSAENPFKGHIDGNYFTIYDLCIRVEPTYVNTGLIACNAGSLENLTFNSTQNSEVLRDYKVYDVASKDDSTSKWYIENMGIACGFNTSTGVIKNVHIKNQNAQVQFPGQRRNIWTKTTNFGGIVGKNEGHTSYCSIEDSTIYFSVPETKVDVNGGGIIGLNNSSYPVENCSFVDSNLHVQVGIKGTTTDYYIYANAGGIVGRANDGTFRQCIIGNINGDINSKTANKIVAEVSGRDAWSVGSVAKRHNPRAGGIAGTVEKNSGGSYSVTFKNCIIYNSLCNNKNGIGTILSVTEALSEVPGYINYGLLFGYGFNGGAIDEKFTDIYVDIQSGSQFTGTKTTNIPSKENGAHNQRCTMSDLPSYFTASKEFVKLPDNFPGLFFKGVDMRDQSFTLEIDENATTFFVGERFTPGNLKVYANYNDGSAAFQVNEFVIDSSSYNENIAGTYAINVFAYSKKIGTYNVTVVDPKAVSLVVTKNPDKTEYFEGEEFDCTGMEATVFKDNGSSETVVVTPSNINFNKKLEAGVNNIGIEIDGVVGKYKVLGKVRNVTRIEITKQPEIKEYIVGISSLDLRGLEVTAYYDNGTSGVIDNSKLEIVNPSIHYGDNNIVVCYGVYKSASFTVKGKIDLNDPNIMEFFEAVRNAEKATTLFDRKETIKLALAAKEKIGALESEEIQAYKARLQSCIDTYNAIVGATNNDFKENVLITCNMAFGAIISTGFDAATLIVIAIIKLF